MSHAEPNQQASNAGARQHEVPASAAFVRAAPIDDARNDETSAAASPIDAAESRLPGGARLAPGQGRWLLQPGRAGYLIAVLSSLATALLATQMMPMLDPAGTMLLFVLTVMVVALRYGRAPAIVASLSSVTAFDFFFVPPRFSLMVNSGQYLLTLAIMLGVGLVTAYLAASLRQQAAAALAREERSRALYEFARELSQALQVEQIGDWTQRAIERTFRARALLLLPDPGSRLQLPSLAPADNPHALHLSVLDLGIAQWAFDNASPAGAGTATVPSSAYSFLPLMAPMRARGVLAIHGDPQQPIPAHDQGELLHAFAALSAIALERVHYIEVAQDAQLRVESERLRNSLLAALSHDLRTPLTSLVGLSEALSLSQPRLSDAQHELADALRTEALRMCRSVENLLQMARMQSGRVVLDLQWHSLEEITGSALRAMRTATAAHRVRTAIAPDLPLLQLDAMLIERVLCNLLENAAKYTLPETRISVAAELADGCCRVRVMDEGPGLPAGREELIFEKFMRGGATLPQPGVGLGLSICRAIVEAHGGAITAGPAPDGGACFSFTLPLGTPPAMPEAEDDVTVASLS